MGMVLVVVGFCYLPVVRREEKESVDERRLQSRRARGVDS
jgi:hypothetical protein